MDCIQSSGQVWHQAIRSVETPLNSSCANWHNTHVASNTRQKNSVRVLFVDYAKAFDHVDHTTVLLKMAALRIDPKLLKWMHSFLFQRQQRVKIGHVFSSRATLNGGMPQGTWLGPYVFIMLINDLKTDLPTFKFVHDVTITEIISQAGPSQM